jgi:hypothetical protein
MPDPLDDPETLPAPVEPWPPVRNRRVPMKEVLKFSSQTPKEFTFRSAVDLDGRGLIEDVLSRVLGR